MATTRALESLRERSARVPLLRHLTGGGENSPNVAIWQGLLASLMVMVGSWGVGWIPSSQESILSRSRFLLPLRVETLGVVICTLLLALGSMLLFRAWLRLRQRLRAADAQPLRVLRRAIWTWSAPLLLSFPILSQDVYSYLGQGRLMHAGRSPYENWVSQLPGWFAQGADSLWAESSSPYGPLFLMYARFTYFVSGGVPEYGVAMMRLVAVAGVALCLYAIPRLAEHTGGDGAWALWISVANPLFLLNMVGGVHNDGLMVGGVLLGFLLVFRKKHVLGVLVAALAVAIKPIVVLVLPFLGLAMLPRDAGLGAKVRAWALTGAVTGAVLGLLGWASGLWFGWIAAMANAGGAAFPYAPVGLLGMLVGWIGSLFGGDLRAIAGVVFAIFMLLSLVLVFCLAIRRPAGEPLLYAGYALGAAVVLAPIIQPWYLLWLIPFFSLGRRYPVAWERALYVLCLFLVLAGVVDQLSVGQWISLMWVRILAAIVGLAYMGYLVFIDPKTAGMFGADPRRPRGAPPALPKISALLKSKRLKSKRPKPRRNEATGS
ncbi:polyprenol phosphomannose-dependent alpha 1,6 mannosyltransferase MptB [Paeniglutamicibacter sp. NPDC012692]|uniref:polyprenol phosphomannose-dependent alpha 1,6 mannosyltransferase MptB n=1 Tax=Paeniglutamicibacter sp. NPDC012692 TaxID=3364388 RepID=UPI00368B0736